MQFQTEQVNYFLRLKKEFLFGFLLCTSLLVYAFFRSPASFALLTVLILIAGLSLALIAHFTTNKYFYKVELIDDKVILKGDSMNKQITVELPISDTNIFIKSKSKGRGNVEYFVRFKHDSGTYDVNKLFNWNYKTLIKLFHSFKEIKNEKIIWDEKFLLEFMYKKSKGMSSLDIALGKD